MLLNSTQSQSTEVSTKCAGVAQLVEQLICNQQVVGSSPFSSSICCSVSDCDLEGFPSGQRDQTVNLAALAFDGSNPSLSTKIDNLFQEVVCFWVEFLGSLSHKRMDSKRLK